MSAVPWFRLTMIRSARHRVLARETGAGGRARGWGGRGLEVFGGMFARVSRSTLMLLRLPQRVTNFKT